MKVLHSTSDWLSLTKKWLFDQVRYADRTVGHDVWCDEIKGQWELPEHGNVILEPKNKSQIIINKVIRKLFPTIIIPAKSKVINFQDYDIFVSHFGPRAWHDLPYVKCHKNLKKVVRFYGYDLNLGRNSIIWWQRYQKVFSEYDHIVSMGPAMSKQLLDLGASRAKITESALGIDQEDMLPRKNDVVSLTDPMRIIVIGSFVQKKGILLAIKGTQRFVEKSGCDVVLTIVGDASPSDQSSVLERQKINVAAREATFQIRFAGYLGYQELITEIARNLIILAPSITAEDGDNEGGYNLTTVLAIGRGLICLTSDHCDGKLLVGNNNGLLFDENDVSGIADGLEMIRTKSIDEIKEMSARSIAHCVSVFDSKSLYQGLLAELRED